MRGKLAFPRALSVLLVAALLLPVTISVVVALAGLLAAMGDGLGSAALRYVALGCGVLWVVDLVAIVLLQAIDTLNRTDDEPP